MNQPDPSLLREYTSRINKAYDFIEKNISRPLSLAEIADAANFSRFHFSRVFLAMTGETVFQFILRVRLEKAAGMLLASPFRSVSEVAIDIGFTDLSVFSRNFRAYFKVTPSKYRKLKKEQSNLSQTDSNNQQTPHEPLPYFCFESKTIKWRSTMKLNKSIEVKDLPEMTVAYIRHTGPYQGDAQLFERIWNRLFSWAGPRGLIGGPGFNSLVVYHDDPNVTVEDKLRMSVCITVPPETKVEGEVGKMQIETARYAVARFELSSSQFQEAWSWLYGEWLPVSGYQPDDKPCFEMYPKEPENGLFTVDICIPVKPV